MKKVLPILMWLFVLCMPTVVLADADWETNLKQKLLPRIKVNADVPPSVDVSGRDLVDMAREYMRDQLVPAIEADRMTRTDLEGLITCMFVMYVQAKNYCEFVEREMGIDRLAEPWPEIHCGNFDFGSDLTRLNHELSHNPIGASFKLKDPVALRSFCQKYNTKYGTQLFMADKLSDVVKDSQQEEQSNPDSYSDIRLDVSKYGDYPKLKEWASLSPSEMWEQTKWWLRNQADWSDLDPYYFINDIASSPRKRYFVETVPATNKVVESYLQKRDLIPVALNEVLKKSDGPYRKPYDDLASVARLFKRCRAEGWPGLSSTDLDKKALDVSAEKLETMARNMLKYMERAYVDYPVLFELKEATSICLYLHYLDENDDRQVRMSTDPKKIKMNIISYTNETCKIRGGFLDNAEKIGDICSRYLMYSSLNTASTCADVYNCAFPWVYATNRNDFARGGSEDAEIVFRNKYEPLLMDDESARVSSGKIETSQRDLRKEMMRIISIIEGDAELQQVLSASRCLDKDFTNWFAKAQCIIPDQILYPLWCDEAIELLERDPDTRKVKEWYGEWIRGPAYKIKKKISAIYDDVAADEVASRTRWEKILSKIGFGQPELMKGLKSLKLCIDSADDMDSMKRALVYEMRDNRKVSKELEMRLRNVEKDIDAWMKKLSGRSEMDDLKDYVIEVIVPLWNECQKQKRKISW